MFEVLVYTSNDKSGACLVYYCDTKAEADWLKSLRPFQVDIIERKDLGIIDLRQE